MQRFSFASLLLLLAPFFPQNIAIHPRNRNAATPSTSAAVASSWVLPTGAQTHQISVEKAKNAFRRRRQVPFHLRAATTVGGGDETEAITLRDELRSMTVREIKKELSDLRVSFADVFEKEQLVQRLLESRQRGKSTTATTDSSTTATVTSTSRPESKFTQPASKGLGVEAPLYFTTFDHGTVIATDLVSDSDDEKRTSIRPENEQPFATLKVQLENNSGKADSTISLLLDTACSGTVIRPAAIQEYKLPYQSAPVGMLGAGGSSSDTGSMTGVSQLERFRIDPNDHDCNSVFGPLPVAVQEIGALPSGLDGIIGLSFLKQFDTMDMNFRVGRVALSKGATPNTMPFGDEDLTVVAHGKMDLLPPPLSLYTVNVLLGGRGPVKMLVDTGAATTLLNWKGIAELGLSRASNFVKPNPSAMGAVGSDRVAIPLTHQIHVSSKLELQQQQQQHEEQKQQDALAGVSLSGPARLSIDIGDIPLLDQFSCFGVRGILGIDSLMRCAAVRCSFDPVHPSLTLYNS